MKERYGCKCLNGRVFSGVFSQYNTSKSKSADWFFFFSLDSWARFGGNATNGLFRFEVVRFAIDGHFADASDELLAGFEPATLPRRVRMSSDVQRVVGVRRGDSRHADAGLHEDVVHR